MALGDTARLIATLELQDKFSATATKYDRTVAGMERQTATLGRIGGQVSQGIGTAVGNLQRLGVIGVGILSVQVAAGIQSLQRLEEVMVATNAVIESTGGVAGLTADEIREMSEAFESLNATMDDKVIQSGANLLLTFTNIREDAFEPTLEAALNMNQALGGGEEGLQGTIIQLGKALQDPIRGLTALRRVGVNFSEEQQRRIRQLVEENDLYGAQQVILAELATEFGGQFAAAGETATAKFARFRDAIEDAQMALATAFLPVLEKVADKLTELLADPATQTAIRELGTNLADAFDELIEVAGNLPWSAIGDAFRIMGTGSKALLDAFVGLPPWVQTAVLTGWGLNKLTGGALTGIAGTIAQGIFGSRGSSPANPMWVQQVGGIPGRGAPVGPVGGGVAGTISTFLKVTTIGALGAAIGVAIGSQLQEEIVAPAREFEQERFADRGGSITDTRANLQAIEDELESLGQLDWLAVMSSQLGELVTGQPGVLTVLNEQKAKLEAQLTSLQLQDHLQRENNDDRRNDARQSQQFLQNLRDVTDRRGMEAAAESRRTGDILQAKRLSVALNNYVTSNVSITDVTRRLVSQQISQGIRGGVTVE